MNKLSFKDNGFPVYDRNTCLLVLEVPGVEEPFMSVQIHRLLHFMKVGLVETGDAIVTQIVNVVLKQGVKRSLEMHVHLQYHLGDELNDDSIIILGDE